jgi:hypothetical protein
MVYLSEAQCKSDTGGRLSKILCQEIVGIMVTWTLAIQTFHSLQNSVTSPGFDFVAPDQIVIVSLNGFKR